MYSYMYTYILCVYIHIELRDAKPVLLQYDCFINTYTYIHTLAHAPTYTYLYIHIYVRTYRCIRTH